jgi:antitoxin component YwqK of YwqJK toxin-antitoxin module
MSEITTEVLAQIHLANQKRKEASLSSNDPASIPSNTQEATPPDLPDFVREVKDDNGNVIQKVPYKNGAIEGTVEIFDEKGKLQQSIPYKNNLIEGRMKTYDDLGALLCDIPFSKGKKEGIGIIYMNDAKASEISFHDDHMDGPYIAYHSNGTVSMKTIYKENHMDGELSVFDDNDNPIKKEIYKMGRKSGLSQSFYPSGKLHEEITFENNIPINQSTAYHENGKPMMVKHYKDGKTTAVELYDENGKLQEKKPDA